MKNQNRRWAWWMLVLLFWTVSGVVLAQGAGERPELTAGHKKMLDWCGQYTITGKTFTSPFGPGREIKGKWIGKPILDGFAIEGTYFYEGKGPSGETQAREISTYDPATNTYQYVFLSNNGYREQAPFTVDGPVAAWEGTQVIGGKPIRFRGRDKDLPDGTGFVRTGEFSTDGQTWQPNIECRHIKVTPAGDEQELLRLQEVWCRAEVEKDTAALRRILADDFAIVTSEGDVITRAQMMHSDEHTLTSLTARDLKVQLYGDTALLRGIAAWTEPGGKSSEIVFTDTWLKRDGRWQCIISHESAHREIVAPEKTPGYEMLKRLVGDGTYEGHWEQTPLGAAGKFTGQFFSRFVLGGSFVQERWEEVYESGETASGITIFRYDPERQTIVASGFGSDGSTYTAVYTFDGNTLTTTFRQIPAEGEPSLVKAAWKYSPDWASFTSTWQLSRDEGKTWKPLGHYEGRNRKD